MMWSRVTVCVCDYGDYFYDAQYDDDRPTYFDYDNPYNHDCYRMILSSFMSFMALLTVDNIVSLMVMSMLVCHPWVQIWDIVRLSR